MGGATMYARTFVLTTPYPLAKPMGRETHGAKTEGIKIVSLVVLAVVSGPRFGTIMIDHHDGINDGELKNVLGELLAPFVLSGVRRSKHDNAQTSGPPRGKRVSSPGVKSSLLINAYTPVCVYLPGEFIYRSWENICDR